MTTYRGKPACTCLAQWCPAFEKAIGRELPWFQLVGDAPASAGFHKDGGSADTETLTKSELRIARNMGGAAWNRWWAGNYHCHIRLNGCPHNSIAQRQVPDLNAGRDGTGPLSDSVGPRDNGPRDGVHFPLRTWREGIEWAKQQEDPVAAITADLLAVAKKHNVTYVYLARVALKAAAAKGTGSAMRKAAVALARRTLRPFK